MPDGAPTDSAPEPIEAIAAHPSGLAPAPARRLRRARWVLATAVLAMVGVLAALFASGLSGDPTLVRSPLIGRPAPGFALSRLDQPGSISLSSLRGRVVVVNFWASWCGPCRDEHDDLHAAWQRYREHGLVLLGITYQDRPADSLDFAREMGGDWPILEDARSGTALAYGVTGIPETFFIGPDGRVAAKSYGPVTYEMLTEQISKLLPAGR